MSQPWEPPGQQPHPEGQQPTVALPSGPGGGDSTYPSPHADPYPAPPYHPQPYQAYPAPYSPDYQPYATHPPAVVSGTTTQVAGVIQLVQSAFWIVAGIALAAMSSDTSRFFDESEFDQDFTPAMARGVVVGVAVVVMLVAGAMVTLAILTLRRSNGCRIASAVLQTVFGAFALLGLLGSLGDGSGPWPVLLRLLAVASCATAATLLYLTTTARYCRSGSPPPAAPRY